MSKKIILVLLTAATYLNACTFFYSGRKNSEAVKSLTLCFNNENTGIEKLIDINGCYFTKTHQSRLVNLKNIQPRDTIDRSFVFYKNGLFVEDFNSSFFYQTHVNIKDYENTSGGTWGMYQLSGDTIKAQIITSPGGTYFVKGEFWFKIIDFTTIELLCIKYSTDISSNDIIEFQQKNAGKSNLICRFAPVEILPNAQQSWIIGEKWFWCNNERYKEWNNHKTR